MKKTLICISAAVLLVGCSRSGRDVRLTVINESAATLTNVVAAGAGFSAPIGSLTPGGTLQVPLKSNAGAFKLEFDAYGKQFSELSSRDPWDGMKEVVMTITTNFSVTSYSVTTF